MPQVVLGVSPESLIEAISLHDAMMHVHPMFAVEVHREKKQKTLQHDNMFILTRNQRRSQGL